MSTARHLIALLRTHVQGDEQEFLSVAMELAAREARLGHARVAEQIRELVDQARARGSQIEKRGGSVVVLQPKGEIANLLSIHQPTIRLASMVLPEVLEKRLRRTLLEQRQQNKLRHHNLRARRKLLFIGPPGTGKTMTAAALAGELHLPLFTILLEGVITKFMGETAAKLRMIFQAMTAEKGVYLFDEFDALGARRAQTNDVGEIRRVLNSFLQLLEKDDSDSIVIAATNHADLLDRALFRRFDDVIEYALPDEKTAVKIIQSRLVPFGADDIDWRRISNDVAGLSQGELVRASDDAAKHAVLQGTERITTEDLLVALHERKHANC
ncbi:MAG TPA: ATP-binding protein [Candidatus Acidoferrales bacterium]|nr:ATP-binding protein [Candidatus Acidoferrales bacterium]